MAGTGMKYLCTLLLTLAILPCETIYATEEVFLPEEAWELEDWELEDGNLEEAAIEMLEGVKNAKTIYNPPMERTYQESTAMFTYILPNQSSFQTSVPNAMMAEGPVTFLPMKNAYIVVTRNGMMEKEAEDGSYTKPGDYKFKMTVFPEGYRGQDMNYYQVQFAFRILSEVVSDITLYSPPEGFYITEVTYDGKKRAPENPEWEFLYRDGDYTVRMLDQETGRISCESSFVRDTTAPFLIFTPEIEADRMREPVMLTASEPGVRLQAFYNGAEGVLASNVISAEGRYSFYISDSAGNTRYYKLNMEGQAKGPDWRTVILTIIGAAGLIGYLIYQRRHMRFL